MRTPGICGLIAALMLSVVCAALSCSRGGSQHTTGEDAEVAAKGSVEVTAELVEIPDGAIFERDLYNYTTILKYRVQDVHRGQLDADVIYVGHYNPFKPRSEAADRRAPEIGGDLETFEQGQIHRMALEAPIDDFYMGGIVNKYFEEHPEPIYWGVWTNLASK